MNFKFLAWAVAVLVIGTINVTEAAPAPLPCVLDGTCKDEMVIIVVKPKNATDCDCDDDKPGAGGDTLHPTDDYPGYQDPVGPIQEEPTPTASVAGSGHEPTTSPDLPTPTEPVAHEPTPTASVAGDGRHPGNDTDLDGPDDECQEGDEDCECYEEDVKDDEDCDYYWSSSSSSSSDSDSDSDYDNDDCEEDPTGTNGGDHDYDDCEEDPTGTNGGDGEGTEPPVDGTDDSGSGQQVSLNPGSSAHRTTQSFIAFIVVAVGTVFLV